MTTKKVLQTSEGLVIGKGATTVTLIEVTEFPGASGKSQTVAEGSLALGASGSAIAGNAYLKHTPGSGTDKWLKLVDTDDLDDGVIGNRIFDPKESVYLATTAALDVTASGSKKGKTLTANSNGALALDGVTATVTTDPGTGKPIRVLVKNGSIANGAIDNGIYDITQVGDAGTPFILTRSGDSDDDVASEITAGANTWVEAGTDNGNTRFILLATGDVDVDVDTQNWQVFLKFGDVSALFQEVDNIEITIGSAINDDGTFAGFTGTNHVDPALSITNAIELLDTEIGPDLTANARTNNPVVSGNDINDNLEALDDAIGSDAQLTPLVRTVGQLALTDSVYTDLDNIDTYLGQDSDLTPVARTVGTVSNTQTTKQLADNLDAAIGADPTPEARTIGPISATQSANANIDNLDIAIGADTTVNNYTSTANSVNQNLDALDSQVKSNSDRLDEALTVISVTTLGGGSLEVVDTILCSEFNKVDWKVLVRETADNSKVWSANIGAHHNRTPTADATEYDSYDHSTLEQLLALIPGIDYNVALSGSGASQSLQLQLQSTNALTVRIVRSLMSF